MSERWFGDKAIRAAIEPLLEYSRMPEDDSETIVGRPCPFCETPMVHRHCKYVCPNHGVVYDCADTFY